MSGIFDTLFGSGDKTATAQQTLDPAAQAILNQIIAQTNQISASNPSFVAPFDAATIQGLQQLQDRPQSPFIGQAADQLSATLGGGFFGANPAFSGAAFGFDNSAQNPAFAGFATQQNPFVQNFETGLGGVTQAIQRAAQQSVGDQFSSSGRTGAPSQSIDLAKIVSNQLAPFEFGAFQQQQQLGSQSFENERQRQLAALGLQSGVFDNQQSRGLAALGLQSSAFENERQRQLAALGLAPGIEGLQDSQALRLLGVGDLIQQQNLATLQEPLQAFNFALNPLIAAQGGLPIGSTGTRGQDTGIFGDVLRSGGLLGDILGLFGG